LGQEQLISRSQAKRLVARFDRFKTVTLDFEGIDEIGQAFAESKRQTDRFKGVSGKEEIIQKLRKAS